MRALINWLDDRTGVRRIVHESLYENIPGGARWRFVTGSMLVFAFVTQAITGLFLWMCYSPSTTTAWESVYYIQNELAGGWLLRGVHHFMAQAMVTLLPIHMLQVIWDKAYRAPREVNYWLGMVLMLLTLALSLTGYLLPWDQKGFWATRVATNLMTLAPGGAQAQRLAVGGSDYGHLTLTRFFALHAGLLPALLVGVLVLHLALFRKHGITAESSDRRPDQFFWPYQVLKDSVACLVLLGVVLLLVLRFNVWGLLTGDLGDTSQLGAHLGPPADSAEEYKAARPEWYFLFLFQMLKYFTADTEFIGAIVLPAAVVGFLFLMPLIGRYKWGHRLNVGVFVLLIAGAAGLTLLALNEDHFSRLAGEYDANKYESAEKQAIYTDKYRASEDYLAAQGQSHEEYERVRELAQYYGIPRTGAVSLQRQDPETMGPRLFRLHCASCHAHASPEGVGIAGPPPSADGSPFGAPNLYQFADREWVRGLLDPERVSGPDYYGDTAHGRKDEDGNWPAGGMVEYVHDELDLPPEDLEKVAVALSSVAQLKYQAKQDADARENGMIEEGISLIEDNCSGCHEFNDSGTGYDAGPDLTDWGSAKWLTGMIADPNAERFYSYDPGNDRMPAFQSLLSEHELEMLVRWLRADDKVLGTPEE